EKTRGKDSWDAITLRYQHALTLANLGRDAEARAEAAIPVDPNHADYDEGWINRMQGSIALLTGDHEAAVAKLRVAEQLLAGPQAAWRLPTILTHLGLAQLEGGDSAAALATLTRALQASDALKLRMNPTYAEALYGLGR